MEGRIEDMSSKVKGSPVYMHIGISVIGIVVGLAYIVIPSVYYSESTDFAAGWILAVDILLGLAAVIASAATIMQRLNDRFIPNGAYCLSGVLGSFGYAAGLLVYFSGWISGTGGVARLRSVIGIFGLLPVVTAGVSVVVMFVYGLWKCICTFEKKDNTIVVAPGGPDPSPA